MIKKISITVMILLVAVLFLPSPQDFRTKTSEQAIKSSVVRLTTADNKGSCTGEQVKAASGAEYILTAGHCAILANEQGSMKVITEDGREVMRRIIAEDANSDLLLLEAAPNTRAMEIAANIHSSEHLRSFTHGQGLDTYKTEGEYVQEQEVEIPLFIVTSDNEGKCNMPKLKMKDMPIFFGFMVKVCSLVVKTAITTVPIVPGSSGGPIVNDNGDLTGVASASAPDSFISILVRLQDIQNFLKNY